MTLDFTVSIGKQCKVYLTIYDANNNITDLQVASVTWSVNGTSISKTTDDWTIFPAHPMYEAQLPAWTPYVTATRSPCFVIRLYPSDTIGLTAGNYTHILGITDGGVTKNYSGTMTATSGGAWGPCI